MPLSKPYFFVCVCSLTLLVSTLIKIMFKSAISVISLFNEPFELFSFRKDCFDTLLMTLVTCNQKKVPFFSFLKPNSNKTNESTLYKMFSLFINCQAVCLHSQIEILNGTQYSHPLTSLWLKEVIISVNFNVVYSMRREKKIFAKGSDTL